MGSSVIPPLPPGFTLDSRPTAPSGGGGVPPLPPGFRLDAPAAVPTAQPSWIDALSARWDAAAPRREGAAKAVAGMLTGVYDLPTDVLNVVSGERRPTAREALAVDPSNPTAPNITPTPDEEGGYTAANVAAFLAPTPAGKGPLAAAALAAAQAGLTARVQGASGSDVAQAAALSAAGPVVAAGARRAAPIVQRAAEVQYGRALNATTRPLKEQSARIVPELLNRQVRGSLETLAETGRTNAAMEGQAISRAYTEASNAGMQSRTAPILKDLDKVKQRFFARSNAGTPIPANPAAIAKVEAIQELVRQFGPTARPDQLWAMRKNIDDIVEAAGGFSGPVTRGTTKAIQREARTAMQRELNKAHPDIVALNAEFSLWKGLEDVATATIKRKEGQSGIVEMGIRGSIGTAGGLLLGDHDPKWAGVGFILGAVTKHPLYRTVSASEKARLAHALSQGNADEASRLLTRALAGFSASDGSPRRTP